MPPILRNTPKSYRACILYEVQLGRSIREAYKNVYKNTKNDKFGNVEFEYWFNRFANGNIDLDEESFAKKPQSLSDLPIEIVGEIVEELDFKDRLNTRKVSRFLRSVVDNKTTEYGPKNIFIQDSSITIEFDDNRVTYKKNDDECLMKYQSSKSQYLVEKVLNGDFLDIAFNDLKIAIKNPKLQLELLRFRVEEEAKLHAEKVVKFFESLESPLQVKSLHYSWHCGLEYVLPILSKLKPGTLEYINFADTMPRYMIPENVYLLTKMEQWKQAKEFRSFQSMKIEIKNLFHFNRCDIHGVDSTISVQDMLQFRNVILNSPDFEYCRLRWRVDSSMIEEIGKALEFPVVRKLATTSRIPRRGPGVTHRFEKSVISHLHPIPGSDEFIKFRMEPHQLYIRRTD